MGGLRVRVSEGHVRQVLNPSFHGRADVNVDKCTYVHTYIHSHENDSNACISTRS